MRSFWVASTVNTSLKSGEGREQRRRGIKVMIAVTVGDGDSAIETQTVLFIGSKKHGWSQPYAFDYFFEQTQKTRSSTTATHSSSSDSDEELE